MRGDKKLQVGKDQEKTQSEKDSHSKNRGGKKPNQQSGTYTMKHIASRMSSYFPNRWPLSYLKDNLSDILVFNLGNVPGFHLIRAKVGGIFELKFHTTYRNMIIYSSRLDTQNPDVTVQRISIFKHVQAHVLIYLWFRNV